MTNGTGVSKLDMLSKFVINNTADSLSPIVPDPRPPPPFNFTFSDYASTPFTVASREYGRQWIIAAWNREMASFYGNFTLLNPYFTSATGMKYVPSRCQDIANITWLSNNNITFGAVYSFARDYFFAINTTGPWVVPANFHTLCVANNPVTAAKGLCWLWPSYYSYDSLTNFSAVPSPYLDITRLMTVFNNEFVDCGTPVGCLGYP